MNGKGTLTQEEADRLLKMLKNTLTSETNFPSKNSAMEFDVLDDTKQDLFTIKIFHSKIKHSKYTFGARIKKNSILLLELHINPGSPHSNPDSTIVIGYHWHIYREGYDRKLAFPAVDINDDDFVENTMLFFDKFNIINKPRVNYQLELLP